MSVSKRIQTFHDRYPLIGPAFWTLSIQYFIVQLAVASQWAQPYSWGRNTISDLGNSVCGVYNDRYVCSTLHPWMNASFIVLGATIVAGTFLIYQEFRKSPLGQIGFLFMVMSGIGTMIVGLTPENTIGWLHELGALQPFIFGNLALIIFGLTLNLPRIISWCSVLSGLIGIIAIPLFLSHTYLGLGTGGMERLGAYPQTIWLIVFGVYMSSNHYRSLKKHSKRYN